jgi:hypothetical protein
MRRIDCKLDRVAEEHDILKKVPACFAKVP